jgi:nucleoside-triphosphatase THEP1
MKARNPWVDDLKALPQVTILEVTEANRDHMAQRALSLLDIPSTAAR